MNAIKRIFKLIRLGVFCKWFTNVDKARSISGVKHLLTMRYTWSNFVMSSFNWRRSNEGYSFWQNISEK